MSTTCLTRSRTVGMAVRHQLLSSSSKTNELRLLCPCISHHYLKHQQQQQQQRQSIIIRCFSFFPNFDPRTLSTEGRDPKQKQKKKQKRKSGKPSFRFVDKIRVRACGGQGGKGSLSLHKIGRKRKVRPDGGHGGDGGSVVIVADPNEQSLRVTSPHVRGKDGTNGSSQEKYGRKGQNKLLRVPCGVVVKRILEYHETWDPVTQQVILKEGYTAPKETLLQPDDEEQDNWSSDDDEDEDESEIGSWDDIDETEIFPGLQGDNEEEELDEVFEWKDVVDSTSGKIRESVVIADLDKPGSHVVVARGGKGGFGSSLFASLHGGLPEQKILSRNAKPENGEIVFLELELKLIADIGLVGYPNAGKSSLLNAMSRAGPQVAPYPFTTLNPFVGVVEYRDGFRLRAADVPGLIDGASEGRGKGHDFLRHLERTKALLYIVDAAGTDGRDPIEDFEILAHELMSYGNGDMMNRRALVVANKLDLLKEEEEAEILMKLKEAADELGIQRYGDVLGISAGVSGVGLEPLSRAMRNVVTTHSDENDDQIL